MLHAENAVREVLMHEEETPYQGIGDVFFVKKRANAMGAENAIS